MRWFWVASLLPLVGLAAELKFEGTEVSAYTTRNRGFAVQGGDPTGGAFEEGNGSAHLRGVQRVEGPSYTYGDEGSVEADIDLSSGHFRVQLSQVGAPPGTPTWIPVPRGGGVSLTEVVHGYTGRGVTGAVPAEAAFWMAGVGKVYRDNKLISDAALIQAFALSAGTRADDSHVQLAYARARDAEIEIWATGLPSNQVPGGNLRFFFDDVDIQVSGQVVPSQPFVDSTLTLRPEEVFPTANLGATTGFSNMPPPQISAGTSAPVTPIGVQPFNATAAAALPPTIRPSNANPATGLVSPPIPSATLTPFPTSPAPANANPSSPTALPSFPNPTLPGLTPSTSAGGTASTAATTIPSVGLPPPVVNPVPTPSP